MNSSFFAIRSYVKLILLEIPRTLRKHSVLAATWNYWSVDSNSPMYIEVIAENIQLPISKLSKFRECIYNNNVKITNGKNNEFNLEEHVLNDLLVLPAMSTKEFPRYVMTSRGIGSTG